MFNAMEDIIHATANDFLYKGNKVLFDDEIKDNLVKEIAKKIIKAEGIEPDEEMQPEVLALFEHEVTEKPEFKFIEGFPVALNAEHDQTSMKELKSVTKQPEANKSEYVSNQFTDEFIEGLENTEINLIGAECGSGKTTAIMEKLVPYAAKNHKTVLYLCNRTTLRKQLLKEYAEGKTDKVLVKVDDNLTFGMYQRISAKISYDIPVNELIESTFDYVVLDEFHSLYDNCDYDFKSYLFLKFLNEINSTIIALTGTPDNLDEMQGFLNKPIKPLREPDKTNNKIKNIYIVNNKDKFRQIQNRHLKKDYKILQLDANITSIKETKDYFKNYHIAGLISQSNKNFEQYKNAEDEAIRQSIIEQEKMCCNVLATTKFMDVGINIKDRSNFLVCYNCTEIPNTYDQFRSRIRIEKESDFHVDLLFRVLTKKSMQLKMEKIKKEFNDYKEKIKKYKTFENMMKHNPAKFKIGFDKEVDDYERFNPVRMKFIKTKYNYLKKLYYSKNLIETYNQMLQKMYPKAVIRIVEYTDLFDTKIYLEGWLNGSNKVKLKKDEKEQIKNDLKVLRLDKKNPNNPVGLDRIKNHLTDKNLPYSIERARSTIEFQQQNVWILKKL
ncbi:DEAD/DEAH box helicase family protein [Viridibacillus arvi]|uniref:DEAD/DEAH box helicase family protein n=1 Tax=Viridibacillus arvi TaxID=263475 RepID=UPI003D06971E